MSTTLELLARPQSLAASDLIAESLIPEVGPTDLVIVDGFIRSDGRTGYQIRATQERLDDPDWPYHGAAMFSHRRMSLNEFFDGIQLRVKVPPSSSGGVDTTTNAIVAILQEIFRIHFDVQDYYSDRIQAPGVAQYRLQASPMSLRWTGWVDVQVYPDLQGSTP